MTPPYHMEIIKLIEHTHTKRNKVGSVKSKAATTAENIYEKHMVNINCKVLLAF